MTTDPTTAIAFATLVAGGAIALGLTWRRGTRLREALHNKRAAERARYARLTTMPEAPSESPPRAAKRNFGRR